MWDLNETSLLHAQVTEYSHINRWLSTGHTCVLSNDVLCRMCKLIYFWIFIIFLWWAARWWCALSTSWITFEVISKFEVDLFWYQSWWRKWWYPYLTPAYSKVYETNLNPWCVEHFPLWLNFDAIEKASFAKTVGWIVRCAQHVHLSLATEWHTWCTTLILPIRDLLMPLWAYIFTVGVVSKDNTLLQLLITHSSMCYAFCLSILMITRDKWYSHRRIILYWYITPPLEDDSGYAA